jgi:K+-transporting ATPase ATPase C chain
MRKNLRISILYTVVTGVLLGLVYPLVMTGLAQFLFRDQANGELIANKGVVVGSNLIGQSFTGAGYFHGRPSAAGASGYDATASGGSNYASTNRKLIDRVQADVASDRRETLDRAVPVDLVTASASGLDPEITPAAAEYQAARVAKARGLSEDAVRAQIAQHTSPRQFGLLGEPRVNVLRLNLALDAITGKATHQAN